MSIALQWYLREMLYFQKNTTLLICEVEKEALIINLPSNAMWAQRINPLAVYITL